MKLLFIGGTGNISGCVSRRVLAEGHDLFLLNRGLRQAALTGAHALPADIKDPASVAAALGDRTFDVVVNWIAFTPEDIERDLALFAGRTGQYVFISSASVYEKPVRHPVITEATPLINPFWAYSQKKIDAEARLQQAWADQGFPMTIVRPSHTYDTIWPVLVGGGDFTFASRIRRGLPIPVHGDGTSLWAVTHADDFAAGFVGLLGHPEALGRAFHLTSNEWLTWNRIYDTLGAVLGREPVKVHIPSDWLAHHEPSLRGPLFGDKMYSVIFDNSAVRRLVPTFAPSIPLHVGLRRTAAWFDADPIRQRINPDHEALFERVLATWDKSGPRA
jgi:nucleoside-diphosphate-sugar epimerase